VRILAVEHVVPARRVTNDFVLETIRAENRGQLEPEALAALERQIEQHLESAGTQVRYIADRSEKPIDFVLEATRKALRAANVPPGEIDFLIYAGVGRGWLEPATANVIQHELKLVNATCFDLLDACASWLRALHVAHSYIRAGVYRRGLIVNCECGFREFVDLDFTNQRDLEHRWAALTIGEAATATVVSADQPDDDFYFTFKNFGEYFNLCMIPLDNVADFLPFPDDGRYAPMKFFGLSRKLIATTIKKIVEVYEADPKLADAKYDICFGHAASQRASEAIGSRLGLPPETYFPTHPRFGNTVAASIPLGMSLALAEGRLQRGHKTLIVVGSAGVAVAMASFRF
jgi:3-oxoacyl-[acyl-carrier-protein] synthase III